MLQGCSGRRMLGRRLGRWVGLRIQAFGIRVSGLAFGVGFQVSGSGGLGVLRGCSGRRVVGRGLSRGFGLRMQAFGFLVSGLALWCHISGFWLGGARGASGLFRAAQEGRGLGGWFGLRIQALGFRVSGLAFGRRISGFGFGGARMGPWAPMTQPEQRKQRNRPTQARPDPKPTPGFSVLASDFTFRAPMRSDGLL